MNKSRSGGRKAWFLTLLRTAHPSVTDAPLIEPGLLNYATGASLDVHVAMRAYVDVSDEFIRFVVSGGKEVTRVLASEVNDPDGEVVRGEREARKDLTDPDERGGDDAIDVPGPRELRKQAGAVKKARSGEAQWAVHVAPGRTPTVPLEHDE